MNTDMILPEVHIALQIQSFFVSYLFNFFHFASYSNVFFLFFFFSDYCELLFSFSYSILENCPAAQFSREQKYTVEILFFLNDCILYH